MLTPNFIAIYENAANEDYCKSMIAEHQKLEDTSSIATIEDRGENANGGLQNRKDLAFYFDRDAMPLAVRTNEILNECLAKYVDEHPAFGMIPAYSVTVKVQKTGPKGGFHMWHGERGNSENRARVLTWMIYLNDTPEGEGTTEFIEQGLQVQPKQGTVVLFPADWTHTHRGNPVYTQDKYIATGWYYLGD